RKELGERARAFGERTAARAAYDADAGRISQWLEAEPRPSAQGFAVFACEAAGLFEGVELNAPVDTELVVGRVPHLYPLARLLARDEVVIPLVREALPKTLAERVVEIGNLDLVSSEAEILEETLDVARREDARDDAERVARMLDAYRAGGLGMIGVPGVTAALENGQVHELLVVADPSRLEGADGAAIADALVAKARQTGARVTFIEDAALLAEAGGVGALLRFRLHRRAA